MLALTLSVSGCGLRSRAGTGNVTLTVTRSFGAQPIGFAAEARAPRGLTVMRMLQRSFAVIPRSQGDGVQAIDGRTGDPHQGWSYYVNGVEASTDASSAVVRRGDRIWWDLHDWSQTHSVPAVVGSFPEPFLHGVAGKRLPTVIECGAGQTAACAAADRALRDIGVPAASQLLGTGSGTDSLGVLVGTWAQLRGTIVGELLARGPGRSGVYARFTGTAGDSLELLDARGSVVRRLGAGAGLVAATRDQVSVPAWIITGTDPAGVASAAAALRAPRLRDHFALAVQGRASIPVPLP